MALYQLQINPPYVLILEEGLLWRQFRLWVLKPYLQKISLLLDNPHFVTLFQPYESQALKNYFAYLLSQKDRLSSDLYKKAIQMGFSKPLIGTLIEELKGKKLIDDQKLKQRLALKKIKKGEAAWRYPEISGPLQEEALFLEKEALKKLIKKKRPLLLSPDIKDKQKAYRFFLSRGYGMNQVNALLKEVL